jgi:hypothetical protein
MVGNQSVMQEASYRRSLVTIKHGAGLKQDSSGMTFLSTEALLSEMRWEL